MAKLTVRITNEGARYVDVAQLMKSDKTQRQLKSALKLAKRPRYEANEPVDRRHKATETVAGT